MADHHGEVLDPNKAPLHQDIVEDYDSSHVVIIILLGVLASVAGLICGLTIINN